MKRDKGKTGKPDNPTDIDGDERLLCEIPFAELDEEGQCEVLAAIKLGNYHYRNITTLAEKLNISYRTVYRRLKSPFYKKKQAELLEAG